MHKISQDRLVKGGAGEGFARSFSVGRKAVERLRGGFSALRRNRRQRDLKAGVLLGFREGRDLPCAVNKVSSERRGAAFVRPRRCCRAGECRAEASAARCGGHDRTSNASARAEANGSQTWASSACPIPGFIFSFWAA